MNTIDKCQHMTPSWVARELYAAHFADMGADDIGFEPTCGDGRMLQAIPSNVRAFGCEIDRTLARRAQIRTGRQVMIGNVLKMDLPRFTFVFGNPPFRTPFIDQFMDRIKTHVDDGCRCGFILPAYFMQTASHVMRWNASWTIFAEMIPRTLFPGSMMPLIFSLFTKDPRPKLKGLRLYAEAFSLEQVDDEVMNALTNGRGLWKPIIAHTLQTLGGRAHLADIYARIAERRPSTNEWWQEKVRQTLQRGPFQSHGRGVWSLAA